jgi:multiple sugar transport system substrate-binding protein
MESIRHSRIKRRTLLTGVPAAGVATKIGHASAASPNEIKFAFFADSSELKVYERLIAAFEEAYPDLRVIPVAIQSANVSPNGQQMPASRYPGWLYTAFTSPNPPDVFFLNYRELDIYATRGVLEPLDDYLTASTELFDEEFFPEVMEAFRSDALPNRGLGALPQNISSLAVYYNTEMFESAGIKSPNEGWTWDEFTAAAERLTTKPSDDGRVDTYGVALDPSIHCYAAAIWGAGGELFDHPKYPTKVLLDTPEARAGLEWLTMLGPQGLGVVPPRWERIALDDTHRFRDGQAAMLIQSRRVVPFLREEPLLPWDVAPLPVGMTPANVLHSDGLGMWRGSPNKEAAWRFIEFVIGRRGQLILADAGRTVPSLRSVADSDEFLKGSALATALGIAHPPANSLVFLDNIALVRPLPASNTWTSAVWMFESSFKQAFYDDGDVQAAIQRVVDGSALTLREPGDLVRHIHASKPLESED